MLEQAYGEEFASRVWIKTQMVIMNDFVGVKNKLDNMQLDTLCDQILIEYGGLNLLEFSLFLSRLRSGKYEDFYGSVDPMRILKSLDTFMEERRIDINKAVVAEEKEKSERERKEWVKNAISYEDWRLSDACQVTDEECAWLDRCMGFDPKKAREERAAGVSSPPQTLSI